MDLKKTGLYSNTHTISAEIRKSLLQLQEQDTRVVLCWIPSHKGILGNDKADLAANEGALLSPHVGVTIPNSDLFSEVASWSTQETDYELREYAYQGKGIKYMSRAKAFVRKPWFRGIGLDRKRITICNRIKSGHTRSKAHLLRMNILSEDNCTHCDSESSETLEHWFWYCPKFFKYRRSLLRDLQALGFKQEGDITEMFNSGKTSLILRLASFLVQCKIQA